MAVNANTVQTFSQTHIREDLSRIITMTEYTDTPAYSMMRKGKTGSTNPDWLIDSLRPAGDNAVIEGDNPANDSRQQPVKVRNYTQLMDEVVEMSDTAQAVNTVGNPSNDLNRQVLKAGLAVKRDMEKAITGNQASVAGNAGTARRSAGMESWIETNVDVGATGAVGGYNSGTTLVDAPTDGTARPFTEALVKNVLRTGYTNGATKMSVMMLGPYNKQRFSLFSGIVPLQSNVGQSVKNASIIASADYYRGDYHTLRVVPNALQRDKTAIILDPSKWECKFLQPFKTEALSKTGHADRRMVKVEFTVCAMDEKSSAKVADLTTSD